MADYDLQQYAIDDEELTAEKGIALAEKIEHSAAQIHSSMCRRSAEIAAIIEKDLINTI